MASLYGPEQKEVHNKPGKVRTSSTDFTFSIIMIECFLVQIQSTSLVSVVHFIQTPVDQFSESCITFCHYT